MKKKPIEPPHIWELLWYRDKRDRLFRRCLDVGCKAIQFANYRIKERSK